MHVSLFVRFSFFFGGGGSGRGLPGLDKYKSASRKRSPFVLKIAFRNSYQSFTVAVVPV